jgi:hypothetical protein
LAPSGDKYLVSIAMGSQVCTFVAPRAINQIPPRLDFSSGVSMAATLEELFREPAKHAKKD